MKMFEAIHQRKCLLCSFSFGFSDSNIYTITILSVLRNSSRPLYCRLLHNTGNVPRFAFTILNIFQWHCSIPVCLYPFFHRFDFTSESLSAGLYPATEKFFLSVHSAIKCETKKVKMDLLSRTFLFICFREYLFVLLITYNPI